MGAAVLPQDFVVEVFDPQAQTRHPDLLYGLQLGLRQGAGLALEGHFLGPVPGQGRLKASDQFAQVAGADIGGRTAAEIDELQGPRCNPRAGAVEFHFPCQGRQIALDIGAVFVGIDAEITKFAALATEGNVQVQPQLRRRGRCIEDIFYRGNALFAPERIGRVVRHEDAADFGLRCATAGRGRLCLRRARGCVHDFSFSIFGDSPMHNRNTIFKAVRRAGEKRIVDGVIFLFPQNSTVLRRPSRSVISHRPRPARR